MGDRTSYTPGTFCWVELHSSDADDAKRFYSGLFGWDFDDMEMDGGGVYTLCRVDGKLVGALMQQHPEMEEGIPPNWLSYASTDDVDASASKAGELGANVMAGPFDVMDAGRMAAVQDPTGAVFAIWQPGGTFGAELVNVAGALTFNQLNTSDPGAAEGFYSELFGWKIESVDTGEDGPPYWGISNSEGHMNGGIMTLPEGMAPSHWLAYFGTDDLDATVAKIGELGGQVVVEPTQVPTGRFAVATDPQGAFFAVFQGDFDD
jgi:predicted enzyme related to lactoylglutathione lyase